MDPRVTVYAGGPIDGCKLGDAMKWRQELADKLKPYNIDVYDPTASINKKFLTIDKPLSDFNLTETEPEHTAASIVKRDYQEMSKCDIVLVYVVLEEKLSKRRIPLGTFSELGVAFHLGKPIIGVTNCLEGRPFWDGQVDKSYEKLDQAIECIIRTAESYRLHKKLMIE